MACKTCGSTSDGISEVALPLTNPPSTCSSCSKPSGSCGCEAFCEEDHTSTTIYKRYGFTLRTVASFVWPAPEETVTLLVSDVERLSPGSILWNPTGGYLHVESFDYTKQQIVAKNEGESCNTYSGGETLPECTDFVVGPPTCNTGNTPLPNTPYLAADFISPVAGVCALAAVTIITGLTIGDTVSVNGYEYRIGDIIDSSTIELCNDGAGAPEGTVIEWDDDGDNIPNIPVLVTASENPCTRDPAVAGVLLVCDGGEVTRPLVGSVGGQVPVWNDITARFELKSIDVEFSTCVSLTADFTADVAHVGSYAISVTDTSAFIALDTVVIDGLLYTVNVVDSSVLMHITPLVTPIGVIVYPAGTPVCTTPDNPCTRTLESEGVLLVCKNGAVAPLDGATMGQIPVLQDIATNEITYEEVGATVLEDLSANTADTITGASPILTGDFAEVNIVNPSSTRSMKILVCAEGQIHGNYNIALTTYYTLLYHLYESINGGVFNIEATEREQPPYMDIGGPGSLPLQRRVNLSRVYTIAPSGTINLKYRQNVEMSSANPADSYQVVTLDTRVSVLAIPG